MLNDNSTRPWSIDLDRPKHIQAAPNISSTKSTEGNNDAKKQNIKPPDKIPPLSPPKDDSSTDSVTPAEEKKSKELDGIPT